LQSKVAASDVNSTCENLLSIPVTILWKKVLPIPMPVLLLKGIANNNTNTFVTILFTDFFYIQQRSFFSAVIY